jgi:hypothetical protein
MGTIIMITIHKNLFARLTFELRKILMIVNTTSSTHRIKKMSPKVPLIAEVIIYMSQF